MTHPNAPASIAWARAAVASEAEAATHYEVADNQYSVAVYHVSGLKSLSRLTAPRQISTHTRTTVHAYCQLPITATHSRAPSPLAG
jgi:hypothetical protein